MTCPHAQFYDFVKSLAVTHNLKVPEIVDIMTDWIGVHTAVNADEEDFRVIVHTIYKRALEVKKILNTHGENLEN